MDIKDPQKVFFSKDKIFWSIALCVYLFVIYTVTVFSRGIPNEIERVRLTLFWSYGWGLRTFGFNMIRQIVGNIAMLMPVGFFYFFICSRKRWYISIIIGFCISLSVETLQLLLNKGLFETDDLIHNTLGCFLGYSITFVVMNIIAKIKNKNGFI